MTFQINWSEGEGTDCCMNINADCWKEACECFAKMRPGIEFAVGEVGCSKDEVVEAYNRIANFCKEMKTCGGCPFWQDHDCLFGDGMPGEWAPIPL